MEEDRSEVLAYLRTTVQPLHFMLARTLHNVVVLTGLACLVVFFMGLLLGWAKLDGMRIAGFVGGMALTAVALGTTLTLLALIAARAGAGFGMTAVLGLPLVLPIVVLVSTTLGRADVGRLVGRHLAQLRISWGLGGRFRGLWRRALPVPLARLMSHIQESTSPRVWAIRLVGLVLLGYTFFMTFTVPLGPGIEDVRVNRTELTDVGRQANLKLWDMAPTSPLPSLGCFCVAATTSQRPPSKP